MVIDDQWDRLEPAVPGRVVPCCVVYHHMDVLETNVFPVVQQRTSADRYIEIYQPTVRV